MLCELPNGGRGAPQGSNTPAVLGQRAERCDYVLVSRRKKMSTGRISRRCCIFRRRCREYLRRCPRTEPSRCGDYLQSRTRRANSLGASDLAHPCNARSEGLWWCGVVGGIISPGESLTHARHTHKQLKQGDKGDIWRRWCVPSIDQFNLMEDEGGAFSMEGLPLAMLDRA